MNKEIPQLEYFHMKIHMKKELLRIYKKWQDQTRFIKPVLSFYLNFTYLNSIHAHIIKLKK